MTEEARELLQSAAINFQNVGKMAPPVAAHPIFKMAMMQLKEGFEKAGLPWIEM